MSVETRQFQEMVREAYHHLQQRKAVKAECQMIWSLGLAQANACRCPVCGEELVARYLAGKVMYYVHPVGG